MISVSTFFSVLVFSWYTYEVSEIYFHFLESIRSKKSCQDDLKQRYNTKNIDIEKIKGNLPNQGVILND